MNNLLQLQSNPKAFREALLIDTDSGPRPLSECIDPWQRKDFDALDNGWRRVVLGTSTEAEYQNGWLERPRGHSKSADLGIMAAWALFASRRCLSGIAAAGDQDQARLLRDAIGRLVYCNPWLGKILEVQNYRVVNKRTGSTLDIIASDAATSYGLTPDFVIADEVTHWKKRDLWDSLISSSAKRGNCMFVVITNAGLQDDWQWKIREVVRADKAWYFSRLEGPIASWITEDRLNAQERLLPTTAYRRLWLNEWTSGGGDALTEEDINAAFFSNLDPQRQAVSGFDYVGGLDLGVSRDASAVCILGIHRGRRHHGLVRLAYTRIWRPRKGSKVNLQEVEDAIVELNDRFQLKALNFDPWQARHMSQRLSAVGLGVAAKQLGQHHMTSRVPMVEVTQTGQNLQKIASIVIEAFNDHRVELYEELNLRRDLTRLRVEERQYGFRLTSPRDEHGHGDTASAFSFAMLAASELVDKRRIHVGPITGNDEGATPFERACRELDREAERYRREQEDLAQAGSDPFGDEGWQTVMRRCGRM